MTKVVLSLVMAALAVGCTIKQPTPVPPTTQTEKVPNVEQMIASVPLVLYNGAAGSGVLFKTGERVGMITAAHVIADGEKPEEAKTYGTGVINIIGYKPGTEIIVYATTANLLKLDPKQDWALLEINVPHEAMRFATFADRIPKIGEEVWMVGSPLLDVGTLSRGIVCHPDRSPSICSDTSLKFIHTDAVGAGGSSGGGLFDKNGICIGIVVRRNPITITMYAVSTYYIHEGICEGLLEPDLMPEFIH
jgi:S1-C subfamily serine protease